MDCCQLLCSDGSQLYTVPHSRELNVWIGSYSRRVVHVHVDWTLIQIAVEVDPIYCMSVCCKVYTISAVVSTPQLCMNCRTPM